MRCGGGETHRWRAVSEQQQEQQRVQHRGQRPHPVGAPTTTFPCSVRLRRGHRWFTSASSAAYALLNAAASWRGRRNVHPHVPVTRRAMRGKKKRRHGSGREGGGKKSLLARPQARCAISPPPTRSPNELRLARRRPLSWMWHQHPPPPQQIRASRRVVREEERARQLCGDKSCSCLNPGAEGRRVGRAAAARCTRQLRESASVLVGSVVRVQSFIWQILWNYGAPSHILLLKHTLCIFTSCLRDNSTFWQIPLPYNHTSGYILFNNRCLLFWDLGVRDTRRSVNRKEEKGAGLPPSKLIQFTVQHVVACAFTTLTK